MLNDFFPSQLNQLGLIIAAICINFVPATGNASAITPGSKTEKTIADASRQEKYTFVMFWKSKDKATSEMWQNLATGLKNHKDKAIYTQVKLDDASEAELIKKHGVSRAPMPMTLAIAPNGAITGSFVRRLEPQGIEASFVTPTKSKCMKALQSRKIVLLNVNPVSLKGASKGVEEFQAIPCYQKTSEIITLNMIDSEEADFIKELGIPSNSHVRHVVFMAPPGVLIGKYDGNVTRDKLLADIKKRGKGCGVEGCEHCK